MKRILFVGTLVSLALGWRYASFRVRESLRPPDDVRNFNQYVAHFGEPDAISVRQSAKGPHVVASRDIPSYWLLLLPDGVPTYVFDQRGDLVDWSPYSLDDPGFQQRWPSKERDARISFADAKGWFR